MDFLNLKSILFTLVITNAICTLIVILLWRQNRRRYDGLFFWVADLSFQTVAFLLIMMRGSIPDWASMVLSNTMIVSGALSGYMGLLSFTGKKDSQTHNFILLCLFVMIHAYFTIIDPSLKWREDDNRIQCPAPDNLQCCNPA
jgi:hypothetical protein